MIEIVEHELSEEDRARIERWLVKAIDERVVPEDEGNGDALLYNLIHLLRGDGQRYHYHQEQDEELRSWGRMRE